MTAPVAYRDDVHRLLAFFTTVLGVFTPAVYCDSWAAWARWVLTVRLVVVLVLLVYVVRTALPVLIPGPQLN